MRTVWILLSIYCGLIVFNSCKKDELPESSVVQGNVPIGNSTTQQPVIEPISRNSGSEKVFSLGDKTFITGYSQRPNNQDAYVICEQNSNVIWSKYYNTSPDDSKGVALIADVNDLIVAFTCTGGNTGFQSTSSVFQTSYGSGGGPKIVFLARINPNTGAISSATFIGCKLTNGNTNTLRPEDNNQNPILLLDNGNIQFKATKAYDRGDGRLTPNSGPDADCQISGGGWIGVFNRNMELLQGDCTSN